MKIALIAHDKKKNEMINFVLNYKHLFIDKILYATATTGKLIQEECKLPINKMLSGPLGGDQQIGALIAEGKLDLVIFLRDPLTAQPHEPDVTALLRLCDVHNIAVATNIRSAVLMMNNLQNNLF